MTRRVARPYFEALEARRLLSDVPGLTPQQVRHAYGFDQISFTQIATKRAKHGGRRASAKSIPADGSGQTIAIVDAFHAPMIASDLKVFDAQFGLPDTDATGKFCLSVATPQGQPPRKCASCRSLLSDCSRRRWPRKHYPVRRRHW